MGLVIYLLNFLTHFINFVNNLNQLYLTLQIQDNDNIGNKSEIFLIIHIITNNYFLSK